MSSSALKLLAASGATDSTTYVDDVFSTTLYTGTGSTQNIVNSIDLAGEGGLTWIKARSDAYNNALFDTERGVNNFMQSNSGAAQLNTGGNTLTAFNSNGFTLGADSTWYVNKASTSYASWSFRKAPGFFDVVTYTGDQSIKNRAIPHNLGSTPGMIIVKGLTNGRSWTVWHRSLTPLWTGGTTPNDLTGGNNVATLVLQSANAQANQGYFTYVNSTAFGIDSFQADNNVTGEQYVAYIFAHDAQEFGTDEDEAIIKCGSYTGNGNADGPTIDLGFEPQWLLLKSAGGSDTWQIVDVMRNWSSNPGGTAASQAVLSPQTSAAENNISGTYKPTSTGFKITNAGGIQNDNNVKYIYMAIRRPHKPAEEFAATDLYATAPQQAKVEGSLGGFRAGFVADFALKFEQTGAHNHDISVRLAAGRGMYTDVTNAEAALSVAQYDFQDGMGDESQASTNNLRMLLRRAPGFFDVMAYTGTGSSTWFNHNLGVVPEMIWFKSRSGSADWNVFTTGGGTSARLRLNDSNEYITSSQNLFWSNLPTATQFRLSNSYEINGSGNSYMAYLFASVDGISKLGTYAGTGSAQNIDCGFSAGARFVVVKRVDVAGFWMVWDSYRGIVAGNDPYLFLNSSAAQVNNTDYIDPLSSGFTITSSAPTDNSDTSMNKSGGTYFFYAIA